MKKIAKILSITALVAAFSTSCDLEKYPYNAIETSQAFVTLKDAQTLNNGLYASLRGVVYGIYQFSTDVQADVLNATLEYGNRNGAPHRWTTLLSDDYTIRDTWRYQYRTISNVNNFLQNYDKITVANATEQANLDKYVGEAYFLRAYLYHSLVQRYAKTYDPATASTDLGVPLVLTFDITLQPTRATVAQVYEQILSDISAAEGKLANAPGVQGSPKATIDVVTALKARVLLAMRNWSGAMTAANSLISGGKYPLITAAAAYKAYWATDTGTESIFQLAATQPSELGNANSIYLGLNAATGKYTPDFVPEQWVIDQYETTDIRKAAYLEQKPVYMQGADYPNTWCINKYPGNPALFTGATTNYQHKPKIFRIAEMYLISAEAGAQSPSTEAAALTTLNQLRTARGASVLTGLTGTALLNAVKAERSRELLCEGFRLDDLKRWKMGFTRSTPQNINLIQTGTDFNLKTVTADDPKFVWGIPANDITTNPSIEKQQNPGW